MYGYGIPQGLKQRAGKEGQFGRNHSKAGPGHSDKGAAGASAAGGWGNGRGIAIQGWTRQGTGVDHGIGSPDRISIVRERKAGSGKASPGAKGTDDPGLSGGSQQTYAISGSGDDGKKSLEENCPGL